MSGLALLDLDELEDRRDDLRALIGIVCKDPACPHCPAYWALVEEINDRTKHGMESTYSNRGCRCAKCRRAHRDAQRRWRAGSRRPT